MSHPLPNYTKKIRTYTPKNTVSFISLAVCWSDNVTYFCLFTVFQTDEDGELRVELWADFRQMNGTILSIKPSQKELEFKVEANKNTEVHLKVHLRA